MAQTTQWNRIRASDADHPRLKGAYHIWSRITEGKPIFTVLMMGRSPGENDGGYYSIATALKVKGLR